MHKFATLAIHAGQEPDLRPWLAGAEINRDGRGEEIVALQRAWLYAGAKTVLMRLWNTKDCDTDALLNAFYIRWDGSPAGKASALRRAMRDVRSIHPNPYHWAAFIICGQG